MFCAGGIQKKRRLLLAVCKREVAAVGFSAFVDVGVDVYFRRLDGVVSEIFLDDSEIMRTFVEFAGITMPDFMGCDPFRSVQIEDVLDGSGGDGVSVSSFEDRAAFFAVQMLADLVQRV